MLKSHPVSSIRYKMMQLSTFQSRRQDFCYRHGNYGCVQPCTCYKTAATLYHSLGFKQYLCRLDLFSGIWNLIGPIQLFFFLSHTLKRMTDCFFPSHLHHSLTLQHAIPFSSKGQILNADQHSCISQYKARKTPTSFETWFASFNSF